MSQFLWDERKAAAQEHRRNIEAFIPGPNKYSTWKKDSWKCPLSKDVRLLMRKKHRMWTRYMEFRDQNYVNRYKYYRNKYEVKQGMYKEWKNALFLHSASKIPKKIWNCVKCRTSVRSGIDNIMLEQDGEEIELTDDYDKAQVFNDYFLLSSLLNCRILYQK